MNNVASFNRTAFSRAGLAAAMGAVLALGTLASGTAAAYQPGPDGAQDENSEPRFAEASREAPEPQVSRDGGETLEALVKLRDEGQFAQVQAKADVLIADPEASAYERAFAANIAAAAAIEAGDNAAAKAYLTRVIELDGLNNESHYRAMLILGQTQWQDQQYAESVETFDRLLAETGSLTPQVLALKGKALYELKRYPEAEAALKQAIAAAPEPSPSWTQLLLATYLASGQKEKAATLGAQVAKQNPHDKQSQMNLAASYQQQGKMQQTVEVLERIRAAGKFTDDRDYRQLYVAYINMEGKEKQAAAVIEEGLEKGVIEPDFQTWLVLAQAYYFSGQDAPAIEAYQKAAPLDTDGGTYLNLARALRQNGRLAEAKAAARQALAKGLDNPEGAQKIIALPGG